MKKLFAMALGMLTMFGVSANPTSTVLLRHTGSTTVYPADSLQVAMDAAEPGDTLLLSKGSFPTFTLTKAVTVRGAGQETHVLGDVTINLTDSVLHATALEGLHIGGVNPGMGDYYDQAVKVNSPSVNFAIRQCRFSSISFSALSNGRGHYNVKVDRCHVSSDFMIQSSVKSMEVNNCYIFELYPEKETKKDISFINCNIYTTYYNWHSYISDFRGSFINCIMGGGSTQKPLQHISLVNTLLQNYPVQASTCMTDHVYKVETDLFNANVYPIHPCVYSDEELIERGFVGNDGKPVGYTGGATPYTLVLDVPTVEESTVLFDSATRKLKVDIKLTSSSAE